MDPVDVWEGIDTFQEQGRNHLVKLAWHILSIVPNSAGCERAFSHMGLVHTAIRSRLSVDKVCKTTVVGMDIKWSHLEAGLVRVWGHRNFEAPTSDGDGGETGIDENDLGDVLDFDELAEELINDAAAADLGNSSDTDDDELMALPPLTIWLPLHAIQSDLPVPPPQQKAAIPLKLLFIFPGDQNAPSDGPGMDYFWQGGIKNLEKEMEAYRILQSHPEGSETGTDAPMASTAAADMMAY